ncbi:MAG TPA: hypothetical protein VJ917_05795, partial [Saprospiraceae bacterium]|nr:hypothetical protein [Saprospiraceae bacterium]
SPVLYQLSYRTIHTHASRVRNAKIDLIRRIDKFFEKNSSPGLAVVFQNIHYLFSCFNDNQYF